MYLYQVPIDGPKMLGWGFWERYDEKGLESPANHIIAKSILTTYVINVNALYL